MKHQCYRIVRGAAQASQSLPFGWSVAGLISGNKPGHFFNAVARSSAGDLIATGDDEGAVRLYRCPMGAADNKCVRVRVPSDLRRVPYALNLNQSKFPVNS